MMAGLLQRDRCDDISMAVLEACANQEKGMQRTGWERGRDRDREWGAREMIRVRMA
jgi:hypothetical protein